MANFRRWIIFDLVLYKFLDKNGMKYKLDRIRAYPFNYYHTQLIQGY